MAGRWMFGWIGVVSSCKRRIHHPLRGSTIGSYFRRSQSALNSIIHPVAQIFKQPLDDPAVDLWKEGESFFRVKDTSLSLFGFGCSSELFKFIMDQAFFDWKGGSLF